MADYEHRLGADGVGATLAPAIVIVAEDWATSQTRARNTRIVAMACAFFGIAAFFAPRLMGTGDVRASATVAPEASASTIIAGALSGVSPAPPGAFSVSPIPDAVGTLEARGIRVRKMTAQEIQAANLENARDAWIVANLAPGIDTLAVDDVILGRCGGETRVVADWAASPLAVCFIREGQVYTATL
jgi:hypothetical protein